MADVSAKASQKVTITYPHDAPSRMIDGGRKGFSTNWLEEVTLTTEEAVDLYNQLGVALYG